MPSALERLLQQRRLAASLDAYAQVPLLRAGLHLGLFEALRTPQSAGALAERLALAPDLVASWAQALHAQGWLRRRDDAYEIVPTVAWLLDSPAAGALQALVDLAAETLGRQLLELPELLKGAERPPLDPYQEAQRVAAISGMAEGRAVHALRRIPGADRPRRVLEVGCGRGGFLAKLLAWRRDTQALGVEADPRAAEDARSRLREAEVSRRAEVRVGDFMTLELAKGSFDLVLLNHNLHRFPPAEHEALFRRAAGRLAAGGVVAVQTPVLVEGPLADLLGLRASLALLDLVLRMNRGVFGLPDLAGLHRTLAEAGFGATGEVPVLPGGVVRYVWARASS